MSKTIIAQKFKQLSPQQELQKSIDQPKEIRARIHAKGLIGSSLSFMVSEAFLATDKPFLLIFNDKEEAAYHLNDLEELIGEKNVLFYPGSYRRPYQIEETDNANVLLRSEVLNRINSRKKPAVIVTYPDALFEKVVTRKELDRSTLKITLGDQLSIDFVNEVLFEYKFKRVDFVTEPGDFSVRGGIIDVFSFSNDEPYRIEFFGDEVESIRSFDVETQLSTDKVKKISVMPNVENKQLEEIRDSFLHYISSKTVVFIKNLDLFGAQLDKLFAKAEEAFQKLSEDIKHGKPEELFCNANEIKKQLLDFSTVEVGTQAFLNPTAVHQYKTKPQPSFNKNFDLLIENLRQNHNEGYTNYIFCASEQQAKRFHDIFEDQEQEVHYKTIVLSLYQGFIEETSKIVGYTDHQIFERYHKFQLKNGYAKKQAITIKELTNLEVGDYVTHIDHGLSLIHI